jgi:hypothetical protein
MDSIGDRLAGGLLIPTNYGSWLRHKGVSRGFNEEIYYLREISGGVC